MPNLNVIDKDLLVMCINDGQSLTDASYVIGMQPQSVDLACLEFFGQNYETLVRRKALRVSATLKQNIIESAMNGNIKDAKYVLRNVSDWVSANAPIPSTPAVDTKEDILTQDERAMLEAYRKLKEGEKIDE